MPSVPSNIFSFFHAAAGYIRESKDLESSELYEVRKKYSHALLDKLGIELTYPDKSDFEANGPSIYVGNHSSNLDALLVYASFELDIRILAKSSIFKIPYLSTILKREKHLCVHRGKNASERNANIRKLIQDALKDGASILFFPEGTRTKPGEETVKPYSPGVALIYESCKVPVVPVALNTGYYWPKNRFIRYPGTVTLRVLKPIEPGLPKREFLKVLQQTIESEQKKLPLPYVIKDNNAA